MSKLKKYRRVKDGKYEYAEIPSDAEMFTGFYFFNNLTDMEPNEEKPIYEGDRINFALFIHDAPFPKVIEKIQNGIVCFENGSFCINSHAFPIKKHTYHRYYKS